MNTIPQETVVRYQSGGDIYAKLVGQYGGTSADFIASAAATGDRAKLTEAIAQVRNGEALSTNTTLILLDQLITDPLAAPADMVKNAVDKITSPMGITVILGLTVVAVVVIVAMKNK